MKKKATNMLIMLLIFIFLFPATALAKEVIGIKNIPIYQVYNNKSGEHLYLTDPNEVNSLVNMGWIDKGIAWYAPRGGEEVYRLVNPRTGSHCYTTSLTEVKNLCSEVGWQKDNNGLPVFYSGGKVPINRLKTTINNVEVYYLTLDESEYEQLVSSGVWIPEGTTLYGTSNTFSQTYETGSATIANTESEYAIEADVRLSGSGSGYHAKLVACTKNSAVSFGIQYDKQAKQPYTDTVSFLIENVFNNNLGGQKYIRPGYAQLNRAFRLLLTVDKNGICNTYIDGTKVHSVKNPNLRDRIYLRVEGSGKAAGDKVNARFYNIKVKEFGTYKDTFVWGTYNFDTNEGINSRDTYKKNRNIFVSGTITGLKEGQDWDNSYNKCSGIIQFVS